MKKAFILVRWDISNDSETILGVYLTRSAAEAEQFELEELYTYDYWIVETDLIEE